MVLVNPASAAPTMSSHSDSSKPRETWHAIIGTGQSLSVGFQAWMAEPSPSMPYAFKLDDSTADFDIERPNATSLRIVPFSEPVRKQTEMPDTYPGNINGKTPHAAFVTQLAHLCRLASVPVPLTVHTVVGKNGAPLFEIKKEGTRNAYPASMYEAKALHRLAKKHGAQLDWCGKGAILLTHGEADALLGHETYAEELIKFAEDYCDDLRTPQESGSPTEEDQGEHESPRTPSGAEERSKPAGKGPIMILSQQQSFPTLKHIQSQLIHDQWYVQLLSDNRILCAGPKYQYGYAPGGVHLPRAGYDRLGEKYAQVYFHSVVQGHLWRPLAPRRVVLREDEGPQGNGRIEVGMDVMYPPLRWDDCLPRNHEQVHTAWRDGRGFEVRDRWGAEVPIERVEIDGDGAESVSVYMAEKQPRSRMPLCLSYAMVPDRQDGGAAGEPDGRMGALCDSDPTASAGASRKAVDVEQGGAAVECAAGWDEVALYDELLHEASGERYTVVALWPEAEDERRRRTAVLDRGWRGASARGVAVRTAHNLRNYCVTFMLPVAYPLGRQGGGRRDVFEEIDGEVMEKWRGFKVNFPDECKGKFKLP